MNRTPRPGVPDVSLIIMTHKPPGSAGGHDEGTGMHLHRQIEKLKKMLLAVGARVEEALHVSIEVVRNRDVDQANRVIEGDREIDLMEIDVEEECLHTLALHQPVATDLRFIVAMLKINNDLERIGDLAVNIAEQARFLAGESRVDQWPYDLPGMSQAVQKMVHESLDALVNMDPDKARTVRQLDDEVDAIHRGMYDRISQAIRQDTGQLEQMIHLLNISRQLERIADHATNIAKDVIYLVEGDIVRHNRRGDPGRTEAIQPRSTTG